MNIIITLFVIFIFSLNVFGQNPNVTVNEDNVGKLGFSALNIGSEYRYSTGHPILIPAEDYKAYAYGIGGRMQSSFVQNYLSPETGKKRFIAGDFLATELSIGGLSTGNPFEKSGVWLAYKFEFGVGFIYRLNDHNDIGLNFTLLRFGRDKVSPNLSGSGVLLRYRFQNIVLEAGVDSRRERIAGWAVKRGPEGNNPFHFVGSISYLLGPKTQVGLRYEELGRGTVFYDYEKLRILYLNNIRIYYGLYF